MSNGQTMTPEQALQNIDGACATLNISRQQHFILQQSIEVLAKAVASKAPEPAAGDEVVTGEVEPES